MANSMQEKSTPIAGAALDLRIWEWLVGLLFIGLLVFVTPIPKVAAIGLVFVAAVVKAVLVVRKYMHLAAEHWLLYVLALTPVVLIAGMAIALLPDIAFRP